MTLNGSAILLAPEVLTYFDTDGDIPTLLVTNEYFFYDGILYWLLFNLVTFYVVRTVESYIRDLRHSNELVVQQKEELNMLNRRLEEKVRERTAVLELQNEKLAQHAYFNAHLLRGPFCRVKGLLGLLDMRHEPHETSFIKERLTTSITELDVRIREIQRLVESDLAEADQP
jgi:signal transduction histidine kinase